MKGNGGWRRGQRQARAGEEGRVERRQSVLKSRGSPEAISALLYHFLPSSAPSPRRLSPRGCISPRVSRSSRTPRDDGGGGDGGDGGSRRPDEIFIETPVDYSDAPRGRGREFARLRIHMVMQTARRGRGDFLASIKVFAENEVWTTRSFERMQMR